MWIENCEETECFMHGLERRNPGELEFHQAVHEFVETVMPFVLEHRKYKDGQITEAIGYIGLATFSNLFNHVHDTPLDFPPAAMLQ